MSEEAVFTLKLEPDLRDQFAAEADAAHRPASQIILELMREYIERQRSAREHEAWFRAEVTDALREAGDPAARRVPHEEVMENLGRLQIGPRRRSDGPID